ncbi:MAG: hypothetical protein A2020_04265 [Lentisphaerae bacterium GWF2_45_14]|nr:MAG: hypothetical protein A2020_04265 [Lentisphaerae bacterium GWF2_45_14]
MKIREADITAIAFFILFAAFFSFISVSSSVFFLDGDMCNIANWAIKALHGENFKCDPIIAQDNVYYLKPHMFMIETLMKLTGSYISALKLLMFTQISLTLISMFYVLKGLFRNINTLQSVIASFFITMVYIKAPVFECNGFIDLRNATARATFGIFMPLFVLYYFKGKDILIKGFILPPIFIIAAAGAVISQLHPQTGITVIVTIFIHWMIVKRSRMNRKMLTLIAIGAIPFGIGIYLFLNSFTTSMFDTDALSYTIKKVTELFIKDQDFAAKFFNMNSFWLLQFTFLPYVFAALIMLFFIKTVPEDKDDKKLFVFLRGIFFTALSLHVLMGFAGYHFVALSQMGISSIFMRSTKFVLFLLELLALFYVLKGRCFVKSRPLYFLSAAAIIFCLFTMSGSRLDIQPKTLTWLFPHVNIDETNDVKYNVILKIPLIAFLLIILTMTAIGRKKELWKNVLIIYCSIVMLFMPFASSSVKMKIGDILDATAGLGSWNILEKFTSSRCAAELRSFEDAKEWVVSNTASGTMIFTMVRPSDGQRFKIASLRPGFGDLGDGCITNTGKKLRKELSVFYDDIGKRPADAARVIKEKMKKYNCKVLLVHKEVFPDIGAVLDKELPLAHANECYNIYTLENAVEEKTSGLH